VRDSEEPISHIYLTCGRNIDYIGNESDIDSAERSGNRRVNAIFEGLLKDQSNSRSEKPAAGAIGGAKLQFIQKKYMDLRYYSQKAHQKHVALDITRGTSPSLRIFMSTKERKVGDVGDKSVVSASGKYSVGTATTSTSSQGDRSKKQDEYRDPRRADFLSSRSSLDFSMHDLEEEVTPQPNLRSGKKGPGPIKIMKSTSQHPSANSRVSMYSNASNVAKPRARRERGPGSLSRTRSSELSSMQDASLSSTNQRSDGKQNSSHGQEGKGSRADTKRTTKQSSEAGGGRSRSSSRAPRRISAARSPSGDPREHGGRRSSRDDDRSVDDGFSVSSSVASSVDDRRRRGRESSRHSKAESRTDEQHTTTTRSGQGRSQSVCRTKSEDRPHTGLSRSTSRAPQESRAAPRNLDDGTNRRLAGRRISREISPSRSRHGSGDRGTASSAVRDESLQNKKPGLKTASADKRESKGGRKEKRKKHGRHEHSAFDDFGETKDDRGTRGGSGMTNGGSHRHGKGDGISLDNFVTTQPHKGSRDHASLPAIWDTDRGASDHGVSFGDFWTERKTSRPQVNVGKASMFADRDDGFGVVSTAHVSSDGFHINIYKSSDEAAWDVDDSFRSRGFGDRHGTQERNKNLTRGRNEDGFETAPFEVGFGTAPFEAGFETSPFEVGFGSERFGSERFGSERFESERFGSERFGSERFGSERFKVGFETAPFQVSQSKPAAMSFERTSRRNLVMASLDCEEKRLEEGRGRVTLPRRTKSEAGALERTIAMNRPTTRLTSSSSVPEPSRRPDPALGKQRSRQSYPPCHTDSSASSQFLAFNEGNNRPKMSRSKSTGFDMIPEDVFGQDAFGHDPFEKDNGIRWHGQPSSDFETSFPAVDF